MIELMMVLAITVVLAALAPPALQGFIGNSRLSSAALGLLQTLTMARTEAIKRAQPVVVCHPDDPAAADDALACGGAETVWTTGHFVFADVDGDGVFDAGEDVLLRRGSPAPGQVEVRGNDAAADAITFNADGTLASGGASALLGLCDDRGGAYGRSVELLPVGHATLRKGTAENPVDCLDE